MGDKYSELYWEYERKFNTRIPFAMVEPGDPDLIKALKKAIKENKKIDYDGWVEIMFPGDKEMQEKFKTGRMHV